MKLKWTSKALSDLGRLYDFLADINQPAAVQALSVAPANLLDHPRIGERLFQFEQREVRRIVVGQYEVRYEIREDTLYVLQVWHTREDR